MMEMLEKANSYISVIYLQIKAFTGYRKKILLHFDVLSVVLDK